jgi:hypothetical protein
VESFLESGPARWASLAPGIRRKDPPDGITTKTRINPLIGTIGPEP